MTTAAFENARKNRSAEYASGVKIIFPAFDALPEKTLFFGTRRFEANGESYVRALAEVPLSRFQRGGGKDTTDFTVNDGDHIWYESIKPYEDVIEDAQVFVQDAYFTENLIFETETVMVAFIEKIALSESSSQISFNAISDMSRTGFLTAGRILTQRYCAAIFNKNGLKDPAFDPCGWTTAQGGNPVFCTHKREGVDGCIDHNNEWRYFAVEALTSAEIQTYSGSSGGWTYGGSGCFTGNTLIWMADGSYKKIKDVVAGDLVWSHNWKGELVKSKVKDQFKYLVPMTMTLDFGQGRKITTTQDHLFLTGADQFKAAGWVDSGGTFRVWRGDKWGDQVLFNSRLLERNTRVHNLWVEGVPTFFIYVGGLLVAVHNNKSPYSN